MPKFEQYSVSTAPDGSRALLEQVHKALGFIPNLLATFAESPPVLAGYLSLDANLSTGALSAVERQIVEIAASIENNCEYCVAAHSTVASMLRVDPQILRQVREEVFIQDAKLDALVRFTRAVMRSKGFVEHPVFAEFVAAGYGKAHILEVVGHIGLKTVANYVHALSRAPLDVQFEPQKVGSAKPVAN